MKFIKLAATLSVLLGIYALFSIYYMQAFIYLTKQRAGIYFPVGIIFEERLAFGGFNTSAVAEVSAGHVNSAHKTKEQLSPIVPFYETYYSMLQDDSKASARRAYPNARRPCLYLGLRRPYITSSAAAKARQSAVHNTTCRPRLQTSDSCEEVTRYYGKPGSIKELPCASSQAAVICSLLERDVKSPRLRKMFDVSCNYSKCNSKGIVLGLFNDSSGMHTGKDWQIVWTERTLSYLLHRHMSRSKFASGYALIKCLKKDVYQVLTLPKVAKFFKRKAKAHRNGGVNVNIVVEDSLSRPHFFRTLPKTASALRKIIYDQSIPATVLDYEMAQSYASSTYNNVQRLFAGKKYVWSTSDEHTYGVEELFSVFKKRGYTTLFQEDSCWYDDWGSMLDARQKLGRIENESMRTRRWNEYVEVLRKTGASDVIDDYGMTFLTCTAYALLRTTNIHNARKFPKVCFKGRHYSSLYFEYAQEYATANDAGNAAPPFISYTHVITSHEHSGRRIVNDDATLAELFLRAARLRNTITVFASDHGAKYTRYSTRTTRGREEVFQPLLFVIVPRGVAARLGDDVMDALVVNQKRFVGLEDLHYALVSLVQSDHGQGGGSARGEGFRGLFQPLPLNRTCEDLVVNSDVLCLCKGMDRFIANTSHDVLWSAEFALGAINNRIQDQHVAGLNEKHAGIITRDYHGYGACQRYTGVGIARARLRLAGENQTLQFSLLVQPFHLQTVEVFDVEVAFPVKKEHGMTMGNVVRVSMFNVYEKCSDDSVEPKLCSCHTKDTNSARRQQEFILEVATKTSFSFSQKTKVLDKPCLVIISRVKRTLVQSKHWQDAIVTYEALNACANVTYRLTVAVRKARNSRVSRKSWPFTVQLLPRTVTFLLTVQQDWKFGKATTKFKFHRTTLKS